MDWATDTDLTGSWLLRKPIPGSAENRVALLVRAQNRIVRAYSKAGLTADKAIEAGLTDAASIKAVQIEMALNSLKNPYGATQLSENTGPFGGSMTFAEGSRGGLVITEDMYDDLGIPSFTTSRQTGSVPMWN